MYFDTMTFHFRRTAQDLSWSLAPPTVLSLRKKAGWLRTPMTLIMETSTSTATSLTVGTGRHSHAHASPLSTAFSPGPRCPPSAR